MKRVNFDLFCISVHDSKKGEIHLFNNRGSKPNVRGKAYYNAKCIYRVSH